MGHLSSKEAWPMSVNVISLKRLITITVPCHGYIYLHQNKIFTEEISVIFSILSFVPKSKLMKIYFAIFSSLALKNKVTKILIFDNYICHK